MAKNTDLEAQIAKAIKSGTAAKIGSLLAPADRGAKQAEEAAEQARARALDPALAGPALAEARRQAEDAKFTAERASAAAERLREAHRERQATEEDAKRREVYAEAVAARDAAAAALAARYLRLANELADLLEGAAKADELVNRANAALPSGARRIDLVDLARPGAGPMTRPLALIALPDWHADSPPLWGTSDRLGAGERFIRNRPAELEAEGTPEEAA